MSIEEQSLSFDVDQIGVPVLVRVSYFPNWNIDGATGPYRIGPNMMVVVPTSTHVEMHYGRSMTDWLTMLITVGGIALCVLWRRRGDVVHAADTPTWGPVDDRDADRDADDYLADPDAPDDRDRVPTSVGSDTSAWLADGEESTMHGAVTGRSMWAADEPAEPNPPAGR